jgi:hypothetical protein
MFPRAGRRRFMERKNKNMITCTKRNGQKDNVKLRYAERDGDCNLPVNIPSKRKNTQRGPGRTLQFHPHIYFTNSILAAMLPLQHMHLVRAGRIIRIADEAAIGDPSSEIDRKISLEMAIHLISAIEMGA